MNYTCKVECTNTVTMVAKSLSAKGLGKGKATPGKGQRATVPGREAPDAMFEEWARTDAAAMAHLLSLIPSAHLKVRIPSTRSPQPAPPPACERRGGDGAAAPCARPGLHAPRPRSRHA